MKPIILQDEWTSPLHMTGRVTLLPLEPENEAVRLLHEAVKEVTGKEVEVKPKPRIGFLP